MLSYVERDGNPPGRLYVDAGTDEGAGTVRDARELMTILRGKGFGDDRLRFVTDEGGRHEEAHWARRLVPALDFLLRPITTEKVRRRRTLG
jgi:hypothetical protein